MCRLCVFDININKIYQQYIGFQIQIQYISNILDFKFKINKKCVGSPCTYFQIRNRENTKIENWLDDDDQNDDNGD